MISFIRDNEFEEQIVSLYTFDTANDRERAKEVAAIARHRHRIASSQEVAELVEALEEAVDAIEGRIDDLDQQICCSGHHCGCRGSTHRDLIVFDLRAVIAKARGNDLEARIAATQEFAARDSARRTAPSKHKGVGQ